MGSSWAALAAEEDLHERGAMNLLAEAGAVGGGRGDRTAEQREQWEDPLATQPDRENELSQTNRGVQGVCEGVVPRVQSKLSRALHAHRGKKLLQDLQNLEYTTMKRAMVR